MLQDQSGQKCSQDPIPTNKPGVAANICNLSYLGGISRAWAKNIAKYLKFASQYFSET
jgi:hypothetical protein